MVHATAFADVLTSAERLQYVDWNSSYDTLQVAPGTDSFSPYGLFNIAADQYTDGQSVATYNNAADFYAERGVKSLVSNWTVSEDSQIVGMHREAPFVHSFNLTNSTGTVWNPITVGQQGQPLKSRDAWINSLDGSQNIDVGAVGDVNMSLTVSWKTNAANDDPIWADGLSDAEKENFRITRDFRYGGDWDATIYGDQPELNGGVISMVAYDVTDLLKAMGYADIENAFMFTWEDWNWETEIAKKEINFDYNDFAFIMTNVTPNYTNATPEPATMLIFGLGIAGVAAARRLKRKQ